jgi:hypothetical protein
MNATLTLSLFRPSILDPGEDAPAPVPRGDRQANAPRVMRRLPATPGEAHHTQDRSSEPGGGLTLDDLLVGVWEGLSAHRTVACPACGEAMSPRYGAGPAPVGGRCASCRTTIA